MAKYESELEIIDQNITEYWVIEDENLKQKG